MHLANEKLGPVANLFLCVSGWKGILIYGKTGRIMRGRGLVHYHIQQNAPSSSQNSSIWLGLCCRFASTLNVFAPRRTSSNKPPAKTGGPLLHESTICSTGNRKKKSILQQARENGTGFIAFSPLAQGLLTNRYLNGIPEDSRIAKGGFLKKEALTEEVLNRIKALNEVAAQRGQTLCRKVALAWVLRR